MAEWYSTRFEIKSIIEIQTNLIQSGKFSSYMSDKAEIIKPLMFALSDRNIPFKALNMGAGVKKLTTDVDVCPKCKGTGKC